MNCNKRDKLKYIPAIILLICLITIIVGCIRFNHVIKSRNTVLNIPFNNTCGFVCCIQDDIFYSDSKGISSLQDKSYYKDIKSQCLLFENKDIVYAYEIESGKLFQLNDDNTLEMLYQIDKEMNEVYAFNDILFAIKYHSNKSQVTLKIYNLKDGLEINLSELDSLSYKFTESNKFSIDIFLIDDLAIILDDMKSTRFLEIYDKKNGKPLTATSVDSFFIYKLEETELIATDSPYKSTEGIVCRYRIEKDSIEFDTVIQSNKSNLHSNYYNRYFVCQDNSVVVIGYCATGKNSRSSNRQVDFRYNSITVYDLEDFSVKYSVKTKERIIAYDAEFYYTYADESYKKYSFADEQKISQKKASKIKAGGSYSLQKHGSYIYVFNDDTNELLNKVDIS